MHTEASCCKGKKGTQGCSSHQNGRGPDTWIRHAAWRPAVSREGWKARKVSSRAGAKSPNSTVKLACEERVNTVDKILSISVLRETQEDIIPLQER